jgi:hypothetical protein
MPLPASNLALAVTFGAAMGLSAAFPAKAADPKTPNTQNATEPKDKSSSEDLPVDRDSAPPEPQVRPTID